MKKLKYEQKFKKDYLYNEHIIINKNINQIAKENQVGYNIIKRYLNLHQIPIQKAQYNNRKNHQNKNWKGFGEIPLTYWNGVIINATRVGRSVAVSIEDAWNIFLQQNRKCALSGQPIEFTASKIISASLDRIDSSKGYIKGNIQWVHKNVNKMKSNFSDQKFIDTCKLVADYRK